MNIHAPWGITDYCTKNIGRQLDFCTCELFTVATLHTLHREKCHLSKSAIFCIALEHKKFPILS
ncbi:uncharacterized protein Dana_GF28171 [Drosophila ananassae]|uniref:Uncharacterized protein n=1 Tax=Drosophila ananassae TaxID=7217 RepID=A0A0P9BPF3_DROAN|nr:uncharacterized protein Dana_GF28171 [Drosophila ananassae]